VCSNLGVCGTANPKPTTRCAGASGYKCDYSGVPNVSVDANGNLTATEPQCDGLDNNCNGPCDETFPDVLVAGGTCNNPHAAKSCTAGNGACQATGPVTCQKSIPSAPYNDTQACSVVADNSKATNELCNGKDDNCNGLVDEPTTSVVGGTTFQGWHDPAIQVMVPLDPFTAQAAHTVFVYQYEASRPDATAKAAGSQSTRACSNSGTLPWSNVTYPQAQAACGAIKNAAGTAIGRLCTAWEWQQTCAALSTNGSHFSMSLTPTAYTAGVCNDGAQTQQRCANGTQCSSGTCNGSGQCTCSGDAECSPGFVCTSNVCVGSGAWPTASSGAASGGGNICFTPIGAARAYDMSGNLQEWTGTPVIVKQGAAATTSAPSGGNITIGGLTSIFATDVGAQLILSGASNTANNGTFDIVSFVSSTSVVIRNPAGVAGGSGITWKFIYQKLRGGAFSTQQSGGLTCEFDFDIQKASFANTDLGFRCCADSAF
jgi:formylglycine-generating enzyme required for sulfatase activity